MIQRGRKSGAALAVKSESEVERIERPDAPYDLTDEQATEWWAVVNRMPADWFPRETHGLLAQYCRHVIAARHVAEMVGQLEIDIAVEMNPEDGPKPTRAAVMLAAAKSFDRLFKMQEREGRAASSLATRLRITQQATKSHAQAQKPIQQRKPHEF